MKYLLWFGALLLMVAAVTAVGETCQSTYNLLLGESITVNPTGTSQGEIRLISTQWESAFQQSSAIFEYRGERTPSVLQGGNTTLSDGTVLAITEVFRQDFAGGIHSARFCLNGVAQEIMEEAIQPEEETEHTVRPTVRNRNVCQSTSRLAVGLAVNSPAIGEIKLTNIKWETIFQRPSATFAYRGGQTLPLLEGESFNVTSGVILTVEEIRYQDYAGGIREARFCLNGMAIEEVAPEDRESEEQEVQVQEPENESEETIQEIEREELRITPEIEEVPVAETCQGCRENGNCLPYGTRLIYNDQARFCSVDGTLPAQVVLQGACQNNYECLSNQCGNGRCIDIVGQLEETQGLLERILGWLRRIFGVS